jgi:hypothetical protein
MPSIALGISAQATFSSNNTPDAAIPGKHQDYVGAKSTNVIETGKLQCGRMRNIRS